MKMNEEIRKLCATTEEIYDKYKSRAFATFLEEDNQKQKLTACISDSITELTAVLTKISEL